MGWRSAADRRTTAKGVSGGAQREVSDPDDRTKNSGRGLRWYQFNLRTLLLAVLLLSILVSAFTAYFRKARLNGHVYYAACTCGFARARISNGEIVLMQANHSGDVGTVVATVNVVDGTCLLNRLHEDGAVGVSELYEIDHLGARYYDKRFNQFVYVIMVDNWKLYPFAVFSRVRHWARL